MRHGEHKASVRRDEPANNADRPGMLPDNNDLIQEERKIHLEELGYYNRNLLLLLVFPVMLVAKYMVINILPAKYFFDNNRILSMVNGTAGSKAWAGSYQVATDFFKNINVLGFTKLSEWTIFLGLLFSILVFIMIAGADAPDLLQSVFILATVGLLNIYVFNIGKDIIQFGFFFVVYVILMLPIQNSLIKVFGCATVLYFESTFFRAYYILIAALAIAVYAILLLFRSRSRIGFASLVMISLLLFVIITAVMVVSSKIMPDEYQQIMQLRSGYSDAFGDDNGGNMATAIQNKIPGESLPIFMVNYVINLVRMLVPVELVMRGAAYLPFFVFQMMVTAYLVNLLRQINQVKDAKLFIAICVFIGYVLASALFEPDFGSWTRHESATFPLLLILIVNPLQRVPLTREERLLQGKPVKEFA
ncbi:MULTISPECIES: cell envelope integrity protein CreD [unclassified Bifidobacterium]|uniref:cell envelope integrity protein CreD n=1 Tax=unclassified Bifidobacterium TaxID=2608897 RepID=UPI00215915C2|nr:MULTISPECIES: cell envelope integrity protein CreD [unclassified Bifidobacterium]